MSDDHYESTDFQTLAVAMVDQGILSSPSEVHGLMTGFIGTGSFVDEGQVLHLVLSYLEMDSGTSSEFKSIVLDVFFTIRQQLLSEEFEFELVLPDDDIDELYSRLQALAAWSQGFLVGFGTGSAGLDENTFSDEVQEAIRDIVDVANIETEVEEEEDAEVAYSEVCEYIRMASILIYTEFAGQNEDMVEDLNTPDQIH